MFNVLNYRSAFVDELVLDDQRRTANDRVRARILDHGHKIVAANLHLRKTA